MGMGEGGRVHGPSELHLSAAFDWSCVWAIRRRFLCGRGAVELVN